MDFQQPKPKKCHHVNKQNLPLPIKLKKDGSVAKISACFNGFSVIVTDEYEMKNLISMGSFGKANCSRSFPQFTSHKPEILRDRQLKNRKKLSQKVKHKSNLEKVIVVSDSDQEDLTHYFTNLKPQYQIDNSGLKETVWLGLEEAFFLVEAVECLEVFYESKLLSADELWNLFSKNQPNFIQNYVVYYYYRCKNWIVKPGVKFGGDFLLYKQGPAFYHASFVVIIQQASKHSTSCDNMSIFGLNRLCETAAKELLICTIHWPENIECNYKNLSKVKVQELLLRRWTSTTERDS